MFLLDYLQFLVIILVCFIAIGFFCVCKRHHDGLQADLSIDKACLVIGKREFISRTA